MNRRFAYWTLGLIGAFLCSFALSAELAATVGWAQRLAMGTLVPGIVRKVNVRVGERVKAGELLIALDQRAFRARLEAANARAKYAGILLDEARREFERAQELYDRTVLSEHDFTVARIGLRKAQSEEAQARSQLAQARQALAFSRIKAPFDGLVVDLNAFPGQAVTSALRVPELVVLAADHRLHISAQADGSTLDGLAGAGKVHVKLGGRDLVADSVLIGREAHRDVQGQLLYPVTVVVERPADLSVRAGQPARIVWH